MLVDWLVLLMFSLFRFLFIYLQFILFILNDWIFNPVWHQFVKGLTQYNLKPGVYMISGPSIPGPGPSQPFSYMETLWQVDKAEQHERPAWGRSAGLS